MAAPTVRPQQYRLGWPLSPEQVEHIDTMFETLFRALRKAGVAVSTPTNEPLAAQAFGLAGTQAGDGEGADALSELRWIAPASVGATGARGPQGLQGVPGQDGEDADDRYIILSSSSAAASSSGPQPYDPGTTVITTNQYMVMANQLILTGSETMTIEGDGELAIVT